MLNATGFLLSLTHVGAGTFSNALGFYLQKRSKTKFKENNF